jgi:phosphoesterase RecJ-like protein
MMDSATEVYGDDMLNVIQAIRTHRRFLVVSHYNPDPDAYGSSSAVYHLLKAIGKSAVLLNESGAVDRHCWIPEVSETVSVIPEGQFDCAIVLDCGALDRVGDSLKGRIASCSTIVNIDHHVSNERFGTINCVDIKASSTSEVLYPILAEFDSGFDEKIATALLAGIYGDTGSFRYGCTTQRTFEIALELIRKGAVPYEVASNLFSQVSVAGTRLQAAALLEMVLHAGGRVAELVVPASYYDRYGACEEDTAVLAERARDISGVLISVLIREDQGIWRISLRTKDASINLSELAASYGGGGHKAAAAFRWRRSLEELQSDLIPRLVKLAETVS